MPANIAAAAIFPDALQASGQTAADSHFLLPFFLPFPPLPRPDRQTLSSNVSARPPLSRAAAAGQADTFIQRFFVRLFQPPPRSYRPFRQPE